MKKDAFKRYVKLNEVLTPKQNAEIIIKELKLKGEK